MSLRFRPKNPRKNGAEIRVRNHAVEASESLLCWLSVDAYQFVALTFIRERQIQYQGVGKLPWLPSLRKTRVCSPDAGAGGASAIGDSGLF